MAGADYPCLLLHQECFNEAAYATEPRTQNTFDKYSRNYFKDKKTGAKSSLTTEEKIAKLPDFGSLRLGSCAIVGNADNLLRGKYGKQIDEHDFVVRFNVVTKPYKEGVGSFASALFIKPNYQDTPFARDLDPIMFNFFPKYAPPSPPLSSAQLPSPQLSATQTILFAQRREKMRRRPKVERKWLKSEFRKRRKTD